MLFGTAEWRPVWSTSNPALEERADSVGIWQYSTEKTLEEFAEHVDAVDRDQVLGVIEKAKASMSGEDAEELKLAIDELSGLAYQMTEKLYATLGSAE